MKAGVLLRRGDIQYLEQPEPQTVSGKLKVRVMACGICGSDIPRVFGNEAHFYPVILGHEFSGVISEVGDGVEGFSVGDRVAVAPLVPCMKCPQCLKGEYAQCKSYSFIGSREPGAFAETVVIPAANAVKIGQNVSFETGALFEPATVALHGILQAGFRGGRKAAVLGCGNIGILTAQWLKILGARSVSVFDISSERLALAARLGADHVYLTNDEEFTAKKQELIADGGFDDIFETAGQPATIQLGFSLTAPRGSFCCIGTPHRDFEFPWKLWEQINRKEFHLTGSWMSYSAPFPGREWEMTAHYFETGELKIDREMIYRRYPLPQIREAFDLFADGRPVPGKVLLIDPSIEEMEGGKT